MRRLELPHETLVYATLAAVTLMSWLLAESAVAAPLAATAVVLIAAFKIRLVSIHFMELGGAVQPWRNLFDLWISVVTMSVLIGYWYGRA